MNETFSHIIESPTGFLEIRGTDEFVSVIHFHDTAPAVPATEAPQLLLDAAAQLNEYFAGKRTAFDFPVQQTGTDFQQKVWAELTRIPFGETISYLELSKRLGDVKAIRAAGLANGKNNVAIVVPCHRVIGSDGSLTGYAGGLHRKEWLLRHEGGWPKNEQMRLF
jgi:methylated-DNA-[protein]-cysteine S-methyltransferase